MDNNMVSVYSTSEELTKLVDCAMELKKEALKKLAFLEDHNADHKDIVDARFLVCKADSLETFFTAALGWGKRESLE